MKTRKILALIMAIALLAVSMTVVASAEDEEEPSYAYTIDSEPDKVEYTDAECFDPTGLVIVDESATITYEADGQYFTFSVEKDQPLTVYMTEIEVFYKGESCGFVEIVVSHAGSDEIVPVNNHHHGQICSACGVICKNEEHDVPYWVPNGDAGLITSETETGKCSICGDTVSQYINGTATYETIFADYQIITLLLGIVNMIVQGFALI